MTKSPASAKAAPSAASGTTVQGRLEEASPAGEGGQQPELKATGLPISSSRGIVRWLESEKASLALTSYQSGAVCLFGVHPNGGLSLNYEKFRRTMGICASRDRIYVGSLSEVWRLENVLGPEDRANGHFDRLYIPRVSQTIGDVDIHELAVDRAGRVVFVNSKFSCLSVLHPVFGSAPIWKPPFISKLAAEDRCHLNGLAMEDGLPRYVSAVSRSDSVGGWRERRHEGGVIIDVQNDSVLTDRLSMPHSPRIHNGQLWALDSGRGYLIRIDRRTGAAEDVAFCPGFLRGLAFHGHYAVVTLSLPRTESGFGGLALSDELKRRDADPWCAMAIIDLNRGDIVEWIRFDSTITELFDVAVIPGVVCPMMVGPKSTEIETLLTYDARWAPLDPSAPPRTTAAAG